MILVTHALTPPFVDYIATPKRHSPHWQPIQHIHRQVQKLEVSTCETLPTSFRLATK